MFHVECKVGDSKINKTQKLCFFVSVGRSRPPHTPRLPPAARKRAGVFFIVFGSLSGDLKKISGLSASADVQARGKTNASDVEVVGKSMVSLQPKLNKRERQRINKMLNSCIGVNTKKMPFSIRRHQTAIINE